MHVARLRAREVSTWIVVVHAFQISAYIHTYIRDHLGIDGVDVPCFLYRNLMVSLLALLICIHIHICC